MRNGGLIHLYECTQIVMYHTKRKRKKQIYTPQLISTHTYDAIRTQLVFICWFIHVAFCGDILHVVIDRLVPLHGTASTYSPSLSYVIAGMVGLPLLPFLAFFLILCLTLLSKRFSVYNAQSGLKNIIIISAFTCIRLFSTCAQIKKYTLSHAHTVLT